MSQDISDFISKLSAVNNNVAVDVPSVGEVVEIKPLSLKHQKDIISCVGDGVAGIISFTRLINTIITQNEGLKNVTQHDKLAIITALRVSALGSNYKAKDEVIDISNLPKKIANYKFKTPSADSFSFEGIVVDVEVPSLEWETEVTKKLEDEVKRNGDNNSKNIGSIYTYELIKHIKSVTLGQTKVKFNELKMRECVSIIEAIPLALNKKIIDFIEKRRVEENELLTINGVTIEISPGFFDVD
jgi:hypothetical protein